MAVCINCNIILRRTHQHHEYRVLNLSEEMVSIVEEWCAREITEEDRLCQECVGLIIIELENRNGNPEDRSQQQLGHECVCIRCGCSLGRRTGRRRHALPEGSSERNYIAEQIFPRHVPVEAWACRACWMRAQANIVAINPIEIPVNEENVEQASVPSSSSQAFTASSSASWGIPQNQNVQRINEDIHLPNYSRTPNTTNHCFIPDCIAAERMRVPKYLKTQILSEYKLYLTRNVRVCEAHSMMQNWDMLQEYEFTHTFNSAQIEEMLDLLGKHQDFNLNFEKVENMTNILCHYWTGLTIVNFLALFNSVPRLTEVCKRAVPRLTEVCKRAKTALGLYLIRLRTGDSVARIASLYCLSKSTVSNYIKKTRVCLATFYVPLHLGVDHITRQMHSAHNLLIPRGLFGNEDNNPIVICDGTYVYVQKSSNYLFQKKSYSLHKFCNLVKPFVMVASDGYIIDVFGPYAATRSDADIIKHLFQPVGSPLRSYFRPNDIFILDRGFRDSIELLTSLGYNVYKPETRQQGETQLSTLRANQSRHVTLCRWVVEVVNGRFKRDFKIFRSKYFNVTSLNLMPDFRIAAAILNNFHPLITDRPDAQLILDRALERLHTPNTLSDFVIGQNLNRRHANFVNINAQLPQLNIFPTMEMSDLIMFSLGTYQIKQARSYYGEHVRPNGSFNIEVCTESIDTGMLIRARIKSRHQSNRIYFCYIMLDRRTDSGWADRILGYYCNCIIGKRTVGSCAHIMTIVWYLGWARYEHGRTIPPAPFLDGILVRDDVENEEIND